MLIRRKDDHTTVVENVRRVLYPFHSTRGAKRWVIIVDYDGITRYYDDAVWEEVPVEKWMPAIVTLLNPRTIRILQGHGIADTLHTILDVTLPENMRFQHHPAGGVCIERRVE